jgi:hypothetical protein
MEHASRLNQGDVNLIELDLPMDNLMCLLTFRASPER